jgi:hypothetical protein
MPIGDLSDIEGNRASLVDQWAPAKLAGLFRAIGLFWSAGLGQRVAAAIQASQSASATTFAYRSQERSPNASSEYLETVRKEMALPQQRR